MTARNKQAVRAQIGMEFLLLNSNRRNSVGVLVSYRTFSHDCPFRPYWDLHTPRVAPSFPHPPRGVWWRPRHGVWWRDSRLSRGFWWHTLISKETITS